MAILAYQRSRISAALRSLLRAGNGINISTDEVQGRVSNYLDATLVRGLGPSDITPSTAPLFRASDFLVDKPTDPLGGQDGKDVSRGWSALREDLDTAQEVNSETTRRSNQTISLLRSHAAALSASLTTIQTNAAALQQQIQTLFSGGSGGQSAAGQGSLVWAIDMSANLIYPETTGIVLPSGQGICATQGSAAGTTDGGSLVGLTFVSTNQGVLRSGDPTTYFIEQPIADNSSAWTFSGSLSTPAILTVMPETGNTISAFEILASPGTTLLSIQQGSTSVAFQILQKGGTLWVVLSTPITTTGQNVTFNCTGVSTTPNTPTTASTITTGSITRIKAHSFVFTNQAQFIWGPYAGPTNTANTSMFVAAISSLITATPQGCSIDWSISSDSADGPWTSFGPSLTPVILSTSGQGDQDLFATQATPDTLTQGFYEWPFTLAGSMYGAKFSAGNYQANVQAYNFNWLQTGEVAHQVTTQDWTNPKGTPTSVAMGAGPAFTITSSGSAQSFTGTDYIQEGTCLSAYQDDQGQNLTYIGLRDEQNTSILQPGYNYCFTFGLYCPQPTYLSSQPIGIFNPNGTANQYALPILVALNGSQVYQTSQTFSNYQELSPSPPTPQNPWPPYCGRMNLNLQAGWNTLQIMVYVPNMTTSSTGYDVSLSLSQWAGIVFGPGLFNSPSTLYEQYGVQIVRGWPTDWTQVSEFTLRQTTAKMVTNCWAWEVDPDTQSVQGILLNHNPAIAETGSSTLDGTLTGQPRNHHISYLPVVPPANQTGQENLWVRAVLSSSSQTASPFLQGLTLTVN